MCALFPPTECIAVFASQCNVEGGDTSDGGPTRLVLGKSLRMTLAVAAQIKTIGIDGRAGKKNMGAIMFGPQFSNITLYLYRQPHVDKTRNQMTLIRNEHTHTHSIIRK